MFQASLALAVVVVAYGAHSRHQPFVTAAEQAVAVMGHALGTPAAAGESKDGAGGGGSSSVRGAAGAVKSRRAPVMSKRASVVALEGAATAAAAAITEPVIDFNVLEVRAGSWGARQLH